MKKAVLFLNLGGPEKLSDVRPFLYRLFEDPEIIRIPFTPLRKLVAWTISTLREKKSQKLYEMIGGGSPIRRLTDQQSSAVQGKLKAQGREVLVRTAFTCSDPLVEDVVRDLARQGITEFLSFPLYPQYSYTTTRGAYTRARAAIKKFAQAATLVEMSSFPTHPLFVEAHADQIADVLDRFSDPTDSALHLVFSAHSIPEKLVTKEGDPYRDEMLESVQAIVDKTQWTRPWVLAWQSKLGPVKWLSPSTEETLAELGKKGVKRVLVVPISFVTDHVETLEELDHDLAEVAKENGVFEFKRTPGLNNHPKFISCLTELILGKAEFWK